MRQASFSLVPRLISLVLAALLACSSESAPLPHGATGASGTGSGSGGAGGAQTGGSGGFGPADAAMADVSADGSGMLDPVDARSGGGDVSLAADVGADVSDAMSTDGPALPARVLLYHFSTFAIDTVPAQLAFLKSKLAEWHLEADDSVDPVVFSDANLARYGAVAMVNTCFEPFGAGKPDRPQSEALQRFVRRGGGLFGNHCAAVTFANVEPPALYNQLLGGRDARNDNFDGRSNCRKMAEHVTSAGLPATFVFNGNLDNANFVANDSVVLVRCTWSTGKDVAVSWYRTEGQGRVFFTNFAKVDADLKDPTLGAGHIVPGLAWVLGR